MGYFKAKRLTVLALALASSASGFVSAARAATTGFIDNGPGRVVPMYGVPVTIRPPMVKYGPPAPTATISPIAPPLNGLPAFDWNSLFPPFDKPPFTFPDFSHMVPSFPKLIGLATSDVLSTLAFVAYISLLILATCGLALRGSYWHIKNQNKK